MTHYSANYGIEWKRDVERQSMWLGWAQVRNTQTVEHMRNETHNLSELFWRIAKLWLLVCEILFFFCFLVVVLCQS